MLSIAKNATRMASRAPAVRRSMSHLTRRPAAGLRSVNMNNNNNQKISMNKSCLSRPTASFTSKRTTPMSCTPTVRAFGARNFSSRPKSVVIASAARTPIASFLGPLHTISGPQLGMVAINGAIEKAGIHKDLVTECIMGNVLSANIGQAPARQAAIGAGLSESTVCTTLNKVCASGMKAVMYGAQSILLGHHDIVVAGGFESMSNTPFYSDQMRKGVKLGNTKMVDGIIKDGLWDVYNDFHMGNCAEDCAKKYNINRTQQDQFAVESYRRSREAQANGKFASEIVPVVVPARGAPISVFEDDEPTRFIPEKVSEVKSAFMKEGTVTAANASSLNDGAAALLLMSEEKAEEHGIKPLARILSFADAEQAPIEFTTAPAKAIPIALKRAGVSLNEVDFFEINQAFSVVSLANIRLLGLEPNKVDVYGGAVALGHPIGASGARILVTLTSVLNNEKGKIGVAAICNGGGGASAMVIQKL